MRLTLIKPFEFSIICRILGDRKGWIKGGGPKEVISMTKELLSRRSGSTRAFSAYISSRRHNRGLKILTIGIGW